MKAPANTVAPLLALGSLALFGPSQSAGAADIPWTYDMSKRVEVAPSAQASPACDLYAKAQDDGVGFAEWLSSFFRDSEVSPGCNLTTLPLGYFIFLR